MQFILEQQAQFSINLQLLGEKIDKLADAQESLRKFVGAVAVAQANTEVNLARTDERLNSLITIVERYISERRNGEP